MASRTEICKFCQAPLAVPLYAQTICCPFCKTVNFLQYNNAWVANAAALTNATAAWSLMNSFPPNSCLPWGPTMPVPAQLFPPPVYGKKRAVLCGVSYFGQSEQVHGSVGDVKRMKRLLVDKLGFPNASVLVLTEEERDLNLIPTKFNILRAFKWLVQGCQSGDSLVFHYSGHGSRERDTNGDEVDGFDEVLCPVDFKTTGKILDDDINALIVRPLPHGAKLHAIIDTCRSGTLLDLPFMCRMNWKGSYAWEDHRTGYAYKGTQGGRAICFSACDDDQTSGDTTVFTGKPAGALTYCFIQSVQDAPRTTYGHLLALIRQKIFNALNSLRSNDPNKAPIKQETQLSSTHMFDIHSEPFSM